MEDSRNVTDEFKGMSEQAIIDQLDENGVSLEIAIENLERDFNMGTIVRSANAFGVRHVHVIGRKQWNKRGAMATDKYLHVHYYGSVQKFVDKMKNDKRQIIAVDIVPQAKFIHNVDLHENTVLVFGSEGPGISDELLAAADDIVAIQQLGSTRSMNVGVAAGVAMYEWLRQHG